MVRLSRAQLAVASACALVALSAVAVAQPRTFQCKASETQPECHARLRCKADEEIEDCQKRLAAAAQADAARQQGDEERSGREREAAADRRAQDREDRRDNQDDRDDRENRREANDRGDRGRGDRSRGERRRGRESSSRARQRGSRGGRGFEANKTFGLGLELGVPTGLTGKYFVSPSGALDFGIGAIYSHYYYGDGLHLYADYLWHPVSLASTPAFELPFYVGVGLRYWDFEYCDRQVCGYGGSAVGVRVPLGLAFDFNNTPLDIFVQLVPVIDFLDGDYYDRYDDRAHLGVDLSLGLRYWFN